MVQVGFVEYACSDFVVYCIVCVIRAGGAPLQGIGGGRRRVWQIGIVSHVSKQWQVIPQKLLDGSCDISPCL
jgi:hypothetical protein